MHSVPDCGVMDTGRILNALFTPQETSSVTSIQQKSISRQIQLFLKESDASMLSARATERLTVYIDDDSKDHVSHSYHSSLGLLCSYSLHAAWLKIHLGFKRGFTHE